MLNLWSFYADLCMLNLPYRYTGVCPPVPPMRKYFPACLANNGGGGRYVLSGNNNKLNIFPSQDTVIGRMIGLLLALWFYGWIWYLQHVIKICFITFHSSS